MPIKLIPKGKKLVKALRGHYPKQTMKKSNKEILNEYFKAKEAHERISLDKQQEQMQMETQQ